MSVQTIQPLGNDFNMQSRPCLNEIGSEKEETYLSYVMDIFSATTRCKDVRYVVLKNEGTTVIRYQWVRSKPNAALRRLLANPSREMEKLHKRKGTDEKFDETQVHEGLVEAVPEVAIEVSPSKLIDKKLNIIPEIDERTLEIGLLKETSFEFHFRDLPGVILPGQTMQFPIIFRPRQAGVFYETIYLITHPQILDQTYRIRLEGICVDPDIPNPRGECLKDEENIKMKRKRSLAIVRKFLERKDVGMDEEVQDQNDGVKDYCKESPEAIEKHMEETMFKQQGIDLLDSIIDHVMFTSQSRVSTLPFGRVTKESLFLAHNPTLFYRFGTCEKALDIIRKLCGLLVPKDRLQASGICELNILGLYSTLWEKPPIQKESIRSSTGYASAAEDDTTNFDNNLKSEVVENLLAGFAECTKKMIEPRVFASFPLQDRIYNVTYATIVTLIDRLVDGFENIKKTYERTPLYTYLRKKAKANRMLNALLTATDLVEAIAKAKEIGEQKALEEKARRKRDVATQKSLGTGTELDQGTTEEEEEVDEYEQEEETLLDHVDKDLNASIGDKQLELTPSVVVHETLIPDTSTFDMQSGKGKKKFVKKKWKDTIRRVNKTKLQENLKHPKESVVMPEELEMIEAQKRKCYRLRQLMAEKVLGDTIERMVSVIDTYKNSIRYVPSNVIKKSDPSKYRC